jgi:hypothetical protein
MPRNAQSQHSIADIIGWDATLALIRFAGGQSRRIPATAHDDHWLTALIGKEAAEKLCRIYGRDVLAIPKNDAEVVRERNVRIRARREEGATIKKLSSEFNLTDRMIYNILGSVEG